MEVILTKKLNLYPIGDVVFVWDKKSRRKGKRILVSDVTILTETRLSIDVETEKKLIKSMKEAKTDLLTDGEKFYTTFGGAIQEIKHNWFKIELDLHNNQ